MNRATIHLRALAGLAAVLLLFTGCGRKTPPVPPETVLPTPVSDLRYRLDEQGVTLTWTAPQRTVRGEKLAAIDGFELLRAVVADSDFCEGCPIPFGSPIEISGDNVAPGGQVHYTEAVLRPGYHYSYKVRTKLGWYSVSGGSNIVSFAWNTLIKPVADLTATAGDSTITLNWQPPASLIDESPITKPLRYQIFRSQEGAELAPLGPPTTATSYRDDTVVNGKRYFYQIQPQTADSVGMMSTAAAAQPRDLTPPAPPREVTVVQTEKGIKVLWAAGGDRDLAGYRIYRRAAAESTPKAIGKVAANALSYLDTTPTRGADRWYYSVSAYDQATPANESPRSGEAELTFAQ